MSSLLKSSPSSALTDIHVDPSDYLVRPSRNYPTASMLHPASCPPLRALLIAMCMHDPSRCAPVTLFAHHQSCFPFICHVKPHHLQPSCLLPSVPCKEHQKQSPFFSLFVHACSSKLKLTFMHAAHETPFDHFLVLYFSTL